MNLKSQPIDGKFGTFGGKYVPETLMPVVDELEEKYNDIKENKEFNEKLSKLFIKLRKNDYSQILVFDGKDKSIIFSFS